MSLYVNYKVKVSVMLTKQKLERINFLARKAKTTGLTLAEKTEQQQLRHEYITSFKKAFKKQIENVKVIDPLGNDVTPEKIKRLRNDDTPLH